MLAGWRYVKWGHCGECDDDDARLYSPILEGAHAVSFSPICRKCSAKYDVSVLCHRCSTPMKRLENGLQVLYDCQVCPARDTVGVGQYGRCL